MHRPLAVTLPQPHTLARGFVNPCPRRSLGNSACAFVLLTFELTGINAESDFYW